VTRLVEAGLGGLAVIVLLAWLTWLASLLRHDVSLVDRMWPVFIAAGAGTYAVVLSVDSARGGWLLALVGLWALRLSAYITHRNWGHGEDRRYQAIRARNQPGFALKSLVLVFGLQALLAWVVASPVLMGLASSSPLGWLDLLGIGIAAFGIAFETVADAQMGRFKADPANAGQVMDRGLWRV
jgi:steroid 5-alpha reductase family enzyme